jgi:hypothetical protein
VRQAPLKYVPGSVTPSVRQLKGLHIAPTVLRDWALELVNTNQVRLAHTPRWSMHVYDTSMCIMLVYDTSMHVTRGSVRAGGRVAARHAGPDAPRALRGGGQLGRAAEHHLRQRHRRAPGGDPPQRRAHLRVRSPQQTPAPGTARWTALTPDEGAEARDPRGTSEGDTLGDVESLLGDAKSPLGDAKSSRRSVARERREGRPGHAGLYHCSRPPYTHRVHLTHSRRYIEHVGAKTSARVMNNAIVKVLTQKIAMEWDDTRRLQVTAG